MTAAVTTGPVGQSLHLDDLTVGWDGVPVLAGVDLDVDAGATLALLGESGSGKSTLLRTIAGLVPAIDGRVRVGERDVTDAPTHQRDVGMVFQGHALFPHATVAGNVGFALRLRGDDETTRRTTVDDWLERVGLSGLGSRDVATLSGGQRQRVALARALAAQPAVLLLDEPLGALDAGLRASLLADLRGLFEQVGATVVHVTHDPVEAATLARRVAVVDAGRVVQVGRSEALHRSPATAAVARLVGHPNVVPAAALGLAPDPARAIAVVPLEAIGVSHDTAGPGALVGRVEVVAPGSAWTAQVRTDGGVLLTVPVDPAAPPVPGDHLGLVIDPARVVRVADG